jgi:hypothetical protein
MFRLLTLFLEYLRSHIIQVYLWQFCASNYLRVIMRYLFWFVCMYAPAQTYGASITIFLSIRQSVCNYSRTAERMFLKSDIRKCYLYSLTLRNLCQNITTIEGTTCMSSSSSSSSSSSHGSTAQVGAWPTLTGFRNNKLCTELDC